MYITPISQKNIKFSNNDKVHVDHIPAGEYRTFPIHNERKSVIILDRNEDVVGRYRENRFGHSVGFVIANADNYKTRQFILNLDESSQRDLAKIALEENLKKQSPSRGYLIRFEQYDSLKTGRPKTGLTVYDFNNGERIARFSQNGYNIPTADDVVDALLWAEANLKHKVPQLKPLSQPSQFFIRLKKILGIDPNKR